MNRTCIALITTGLLILLSAITPANAFLRPRYDDADVVARSELIVVASIKEGSVVYVSHDDGKSDLMCTYEHHAILVVHEVIKGLCEEKEIPVIIYYGLDLSVKNQQYRAGPGTRPSATQPAAGPIQIVDSGNSEMGPPLTLDARKDSVWFLRRLAGPYGREEGHGDFGITDPEDLKPADLAEYTRCYLSADPESALRLQIDKQPEIAARAMRYLDKQELARIAKIAESGLRAQRLVMYLRYLPTEEDAADQLLTIDAKTAGPYLMAEFETTRDERLRDHIITLWGKMKWPGCVELVIDQLRRNNENWSAEKLQPGWPRKNGESFVTPRQQELISRSSVCVYTLGQLADSRAKEVIELTRQRFAGVADLKWIADLCDTALKNLPAETQQPPASMPASLPLPPR